MKKKNIKKFADAIAWYSREYGAMWVSYDKLRTEKAQLQADLDKLQEECCAEVTALKAEITEMARYIRDQKAHIDRLMYQGEWVPLVAGGTIGCGPNAYIQVDTDSFTVHSKKGEFPSVTHEGWTICCWKKNVCPNQV
jgi:hypothetical protein